MESGWDEFWRGFTELHPGVQRATAGHRRCPARRPARCTTAYLKSQTSGVECRKDAGVVDEIPAAYKDINTVIEAQTDLVEVITHLKQVVCVKG